MFCTIIIIILILCCLYSLGTVGAVINMQMAAQKLWMDHMFYTREYLIRYINKLPAVDETAARLLRNQDDLARAFNQIYAGSYEPVKKLLTEHIIIATKLVEAVVNKTGKEAEFTAQWKQNAIEIANAIAGLNSKYDKKILNDMMQMHLKTTSDELVQLIAGKSGISEFDTAVNHMLQFNNYLFQ